MYIKNKFVNIEIVPKNYRIFKTKQKNSKDQRKYLLNFVLSFSNLKIIIAFEIYHLLSNRPLKILVNTKYRNGLKI